MEPITLHAEGFEHRGFFDPLGALRITRRNVPHWHQDHVFVFVTWRLADSLPPDAITRLKFDRSHWMAAHPRPWDSATRRLHRVLFSNRIDRLMDAGAGSCVLRDASSRQVVSRAIRFFDGSRYDIEAYVVMPNHVHVLLRLGSVMALSAIVHSWKSYTAKQIGPLAEGLNYFWQPGYRDRLARSERHLFYYRRYIEENPNRAHLAPDAFDLYLKPRRPYESY